MVIGDLPKIREEMRGDVRSLLKVSVKTGWQGCLLRLRLHPYLLETTGLAIIAICLHPHRLIFGMLDTSSPDNLADSCQSY